MEAEAQHATPERWNTEAQTVAQHLNAKIDAAEALEKGLHEDAVESHKVYAGMQASMARAQHILDDALYPTFWANVRHRIALFFSPKRNRNNRRVSRSQHFQGRSRRRG